MSGSIIDDGLCVSIVRRAHVSPAAFFCDLFGFDFKASRSLSDCLYGELVRIVACVVAAVGPCGRAGRQLIPVRCILRFTDDLVPVGAADGVIDSAGRTGGVDDFADSTGVADDTTDSADDTNGGAGNSTCVADDTNGGAGHSACVADDTNGGAGNSACVADDSAQ